jgi:hypothetical protein
MAMIPASVTFTARGAALRGVTCENCGCQYLYRLTRIIHETKTLPRGMRPEQLPNPTGKRLQRILKRSVDPVACPQCGHLQRDMIRALRAHRFGVVVLLAMGAAFVTGVLWFLTQVPDVIAVSIYVPLVVAALSFGALFIRVCWIFQKDPNSRIEVDHRLRHPNLRAIKREDYPDLPPQLFSDLPAELRGTRGTP